MSANGWGAAAAAGGGGTHKNGMAITSSCPLRLQKKNRRCFAGSFSPTSRSLRLDKFVFAILFVYDDNLCENNICGLYNKNVEKYTRGKGSGESLQ